MDEALARAREELEVRRLADGSEPRHEPVA
jgi:hypothetical protein